MSKDTLQNSTVGGVVRRVVDLVSCATILDEIVSALQMAVSAIFPIGQLQTALAGIPFGSPTNSLPNTPTLRRYSHPRPIAPPAAQPMMMQRNDLHLPVRTGDLFLGAPESSGKPYSGPAEPSTSLDNGAQSTGSVAVQSFRVPTFSSANANLLSLLAEQSPPDVERVTKLVRAPSSQATFDLLEAVQRAITESTSTASLFQRITQTVSETFDVGCALAMSRSGETPIITAHHSVKEFASATSTWFAEILRDRELCHRLKTELNPLTYDQAQANSRGIACPFPASLPVRAVQLFPLATNGRWAGGLLLFDNIHLKLDAAATETIKRAAHSIGMVVGGNFRVENSSLGPDQWRGWARIMSALLSEEPLETVLRDVLTIGNDVVNVDGALIRLHNTDLPYSERYFTLGNTGFEKLVRSVIQQGTTDTLIVSQPGGPQNWVENAAAGLNSGSDRPLQPYPFRLVSPIENGKTRLGDLCLFRSNARPYSAEEIDDARQFASVIAVTLNQKRTLEIRTRQDQILTSVRELAERLNRAATQQTMAEISVEVCAAAFGSGKASLHIYQAQSERLVMAAAFGLPLPFVTANAHLSLGNGTCGQAAQQRSLLVIDDVTTDPDWMSEWHANESGLDFRSVWSLPLMAGGDNLQGTLTVYHSNVVQANDDDLSFLRLLGHQIAAALDRARLADRSQDLYRATVESLAAAVDAKDPFTHNHSWQVSAYCRKIAEALDLSASEIEIIELAGLLHDVGKIGIPDRVLQKPDELAPDEWAMMQRHPDLGARILGDNSALAAVVPYVRHHHERYDGHGYPDQLSGNDVPLGAAIVGLADAFDTMTSDRPYRRARTTEQALQEVSRCSGSHFHPKVAAAFLRVVKSGEIAAVARTAPRSTTRELRLKRVVGSEARGFGLLQRITTEIGALVDLDRFLHRLNELMNSEFPESTCEIYGQDPNTGDLVAIANQRRRKRLVIPRGQGIGGWVAAHGMSQNIPDVLEDARYIATGHRLMRSVMAVPLVVDGHCAGVLSLEHPDPSAYSPSDQHVLEIVATYVAQAIQVANLHDRLKRNAHHDPLTGLLNHREFCQRLDEEIDRARMTVGKLAIAILDVKSLRTVNRSHGHAAGDDVLKTIADVLKLKVRNGDTVARYGGDEFALLVPRVNVSIIRARVGSISDSLSEIRATQPLPGVSWGIGSFPNDGTHAEDIMAAAENAIRTATNNRPASSFM